MIYCEAKMEQHKIKGFLDQMITGNEIILGKWDGQVIKFNFDSELNQITTNWHDGETLGLDAEEYWINHDDSPASFEPADDRFGFALLQGVEHNAKLYNLYEDCQRFVELTVRLKNFHTDIDDLESMAERFVKQTWNKLVNYIKQNFDWKLANKYEREWYKKQGKNMLDEDIAFIRLMLSDLDSVQTWKFSEGAVDRTREVLLRIQNRLTAARDIELADRSKLFQTPTAEEYSRLIAKCAEREAGKYGSDHIDVLADEEPNQFKEHSLHIYYHSNNNSFMASNPNLALEIVNKEKLKELLDEIGVGYNF